jgi:hypothetical protein
MESAAIPLCAVYTPQHRVLGRKILFLALLGLAWFVVTVLGRWREHDWPYFRDVFPVHVMLAGLIGAYLVYLSYALYRSLSTDYRIERSEIGLTVRGEGQVRVLRWEDIRQVRFGDLYLKLDTVNGRIEIPFIRREDQREIYRFHHRAVGLRPDEGRFLARRCQ